MPRSGLIRCLLFALLLAPLGCDGPSAPAEAVDESELTFVRVAAGAPPVTDTAVTFWAKRTEDREVQIRYAADGYVGKCMRFLVPAGALQDRDSVQITVRLVDRGQFTFEFEPAGLKFDPAHPAELEVRYRWADPDLNGDGMVDQRDEGLARRFGFWRQERVGERWNRMQTERSEAELEARTKVPGFTRYALATS